MKLKKFAQKILVLILENESLNLDLIEVKRLSLSKDKIIDDHVKRRDKMERQIQVLREDLCNYGVAIIGFSRLSNTNKILIPDVKAAIKGTSLSVVSDSEKQTIEVKTR